MKAWKLERLCGKLIFVDAELPKVRAGSALIRVEALALMSYLKDYVEGRLSTYRAPKKFAPGGNAIGAVEAVGTDVWHLKKGQRMVVSSRLVARDNVWEPGPMLLGITSLAERETRCSWWKEGTPAEYALVRAAVRDGSRNDKGARREFYLSQPACSAPHQSDKFSALRSILRRPRQSQGARHEQT